MMQHPLELDALVVGAGFGGIYATYRLSRLGLNLRCIDRASDVGGTWYWNKYPGAMSDTETYLYRYSWDKAALKEYPWNQHYVYQPEILKYLQWMTDRHNLRRLMHFNMEMKAADWDESRMRWRVIMSTGEIFYTRYLVNSLGLLAKPNHPKIAGIESFQGQLVHTAQWGEDIDLKGKKVGIIGNGSTGVQVMTAIAPIVGHLTSFQRHPQYSVPSGQGPVPEGYREKINENYDEIWNRVFSSGTGFGVPESSRVTMEATPEERKEAFQRVWNQGNGFRFMFSAFGDITTNEEANEEACSFIRGKIDEIVKDSRKASILKPKDLYARRPLCDTGYYSIFNRENVDVVDLRATPIKTIVPQGIELSDGTVHGLDILIFATGFDAFEGSYLRVEITGKNGKTIKDHWRDGPIAYGAIACSGFPNMFIISGPQGPFANFPPVIESETNFVISCIEYAEAQRNLTGQNTALEATVEAERTWREHCDELVGASLFKKTASWVFGANVEGRRGSTNFYFGGLNKYREWVEEVKRDDMRGFEVRKSIESQQPSLRPNFERLLPGKQCFISVVDTSI